MDKNMCSGTVGRDRHRVDGVRPGNMQEALPPRLYASAGGCPLAAPAEPVTIHVLTMDQAGLAPAQIDQIARDFEALNPDIKVSMEYVGYDNVHDKITTGMAANPPAYDAALIDVIWPDEFIKAGYMLDVTDRVTPEMKSGMFPASWNGVTRNGKIYGMPWLMDVKYFMYNKDMLQKAGIAAPPTTWEELETQAKTIKDKGIVEFPIIWSWPQLEGVVCDFTVLLYGNGGAFLDASGKPVFNDDKGVQVLTWMKKTIDDGLTNPSSISSNENAVEADFLAGKSAFAVSWLFQYADSTTHEIPDRGTGRLRTHARFNGGAGIQGSRWTDPAPSARAAPCRPNGSS
jgi:multiple sugar transport system substrate-binding protein